MAPSSFVTHTTLQSQPVHHSTTLETALVATRNGK